MGRKTDRETIDTSKFQAMGKPIISTCSYICFELLATACWPLPNSFTVRSLTVSGSSEHLYQTDCRKIPCRFEGVFIEVTGKIRFLFSADGFFSSLCYYIPKPSFVLYQ